MIIEIYARNGMGYVKIDGKEVDEVTRVEVKQEAASPAEVLLTLRPDEVRVDVDGEVITVDEKNTTEVINLIKNARSIKVKKDADITDLIRYGFQLSKLEDKGGLYYYLITDGLKIRVKVNTRGVQILENSALASIEDYKTVSKLYNDGFLEIS